MSVSHGNIALTTGLSVKLLTQLVDSTCDVPVSEHEWANHQPTTRARHKQGKQRPKWTFYRRPKFRKRSELRCLLASGTWKITIVCPTVVHPCFFRVSPLFPCWQPLSSVFSSCFCVQGWILVLSFATVFSGKYFPEFILFKVDDEICPIEHRSKIHLKRFYCLYWQFFLGFFENKIYIN